MKTKVEAMLEDLMVSELIDFKNSDDSDVKKVALERLDKLSDIQNKRKEVSHKKDKALEYLRIGVEVVVAVGTMVHYTTLFNRGLEFEKEGTFTSNMFKGLIGKCKPTK